MDHMITNRFSTLEPSATLEMNELVDQLKASGREVYHLAFGESKFPVHPKLVEILGDNAHQNSYLPSQGLPALRRAIAMFYRRHFELEVDESRIIVGPGSKALIFALQMALDGELILPTPSWVSYGPQAHMLAKPVKYVPSSINEGYQLDIDRLKKTITSSESSKQILLINSPNNPSGCMYDSSFLQQLADLCREHGVMVISDELYSLVPHVGRAHDSIAKYYPEGSIVLGGVSKHLSLGGWRLGFAILPEAGQSSRLMEVLKTIASEIWSCPSTPIQYAVCAAYDEIPEIHDYIKECSTLHAIRTQYLYQNLSSRGIRCTRPEGGFYFIASFDRWRDQLADRNVFTSDDLVKYLLETYSLATLSGTVFGIPGQDLSLRLASSNLDLETADQANGLLKAFREGADASVVMEHHHPRMNEAISLFSRFVQDLSEESRIAVAANNAV